MSISQHPTVLQGPGICHQGIERISAEGDHRLHWLGALDLNNAEFHEGYLLRESRSWKHNLLISQWRGQNMTIMTRPWEWLRVIDLKTSMLGSPMASAAYCNGLQTPGYGGLTILRVAAVTGLDQDFRWHQDVGRHMVGHKTLHVAAPRTIWSLKPWALLLSHARDSGMRFEHFSWIQLICICICVV